MKVILFFALIGIAFSQEGNIVQVAEKLGATTLLQFATEAGLAETLATGGPFTVFAPTNEAFAKLPPRVVDFLKKNKEALQEVLKFHVLSGKTYSSQLKNELVVPTLDPKLNVRINIYQNGKVITADGSPVVLADQNATNGVIHVIDRVEFPIPIADVVKTAEQQRELGTLVKAVVAAGLQNTLSGPGPFTVFAPTDKAFAALPPGTLDNLLKNKTALTDVLTYHVVSGTYFSAGLVSGPVPTVEGKNVNIEVGTGVKVNGAEVVLADEAVTNGVIHIIDKVLIPPSFL
uniref:Transforming growth factor-beta-induced protein ig-h3-like n=1 Tax=Crassostrea virginica TaxID=6565 RepID=A0A8B8C2C0_CRAVI|nr:transforming growth factor-beta-induced protein ig-h3-like [Crassostrea virginica]